jgi:hydroxymethylglutaryl-CoA lyase
MEASLMRRIEIVEVGPRDGLQNDPSTLSTDVKVELVDRLIACGLRRIETGAFVSAKAVPKMADSAQVFAAVSRSPGVRHIGLALNLAGVRRALDAQVDEINFVLVASKGFGQRNQGMTPEQTLEQLSQALPLIREAGLPVTTTISVAFGDPYDGEVPIPALADIARQAGSLGVDEIALGDTIGVADPWDVRRRVDAVRAAAPDTRLRLHFHNTRQTGLANVFAGVEAGVDVIDASLGGVGGCPFAPAATGNVATEDVVYMLERAGFDVGIDLSALLKASAWFERALGHPVASGLLRAGSFPGRATIP